MRYLVLIVISVCALSGCPSPSRVATQPVTRHSAERSSASGVVTSTFKVEGMHCESCSQAIEGKLAGIEGVSTVSADYKTGQVAVQHDARHVTPEQLIAAIDALKFKASVRPGGEHNSAKPKASGA